jgi:hypothetical protein
VTNVQELVSGVQELKKTKSNQRARVELVSGVQELKKTKSNQRARVGVLKSYKYQVLACKSRK